MIAIINTMNQIQSDSIGTIISTHRSQESAEEARRKFQGRVKAANGENSYIPTRIVRLTKQIAKGVHVHPMHVGADLD